MPEKPSPEHNQPNRESFLRRIGRWFTEPKQPKIEFWCACCDTVESHAIRSETIAIKRTDITATRYGMFYRCLNSIGRDGRRPLVVREVDEDSTEERLRYGMDLAPLNPKNPNELPHYLPGLAEMELIDDELLNDFHHSNESLYSDIRDFENDEREKRRYA